ncbi:hypothetical protein FB45DRAFT_785629 [Roridomyces roridus]|uniref:Adenylate kinase n=1 Tax=Roridomyces roridus TaxID=1738132 RepID=A0AAD7C802_9AGAR|nr:hypothetical protein FB45DRAFT_785629 [Roridomyces roridus]
MVPPLLGDADGKYRVHIVGNCGAGKTTVGKQLANLLGVPFISIDALFWTPGWGHRTNEELRAKVVDAMNNAPNGWVIDGNYARRIGDVVEDAETDVIWLDPPLALTLPRVIWRTLLRILRLAEPCSPGCPERIMEVFFSRESIVWWCITHHGLVRRREGNRMALIGLDEGSDVERRRMRRIGGWGGELNKWLEDVRRMLQSK